MSSDDPASSLHNLISGFHGTYYVSVGISCGLFEALLEPETPSNLASRLDLHEPYVRRFCETGLRWGLLDVVADDAGIEADRSGDRGSTREAEYRFYLPEGFVPFVAAPGKPQYMGDLFRFLTEHAGPSYLEYPAYFRNGGSRSVADHGTELTETIEGTTDGLQTIFVEKCLDESLPAFERQLDDGGDVLDIGCGSGGLACRLCRRYPDISVTGIDPDTDAIDRARKRAKREEFTDRTTFHPKRGRAILERDATFDAVVFFMSLHEIPVEERTELFDRIGSVLATGGVVAVFDEVYPERPDEFDDPPYAAGVETQWSELLWSTDVPTLSGQRDLLDRGGLTERSRTTFADRFALYEGVYEDRER